MFKFLKFLKFLSLIMYLGCSFDENPTESFYLKDSQIRKKISSYFEGDKNYFDVPKAIHVNDSVELVIKDKNLVPKFRLSSQRNKIKINKDKIYFVSSDSVGVSTIISSQSDDENEKSDSIHIFIYKQFVLLKADDLIFDPKNTVSFKWNKFFEYSLENEIICNIGIIGNSLEHGDHNYRTYIKTLINSYNFEIWNHGYNHIVNFTFSSGKTFSEFQNTTYEYQKNALEKTQILCRKFLDFTPIAFGAPGNAIDSTTTDVINENINIKIWYYGFKNSEKLLLDRKSEIEFPYGIPDYSKFIENYNSEDQVVTLQVHPNMWNYQNFAEFEKIIDFLKSQNVTFITASDYYFLHSSQ